jgi:hypothetical protein
LLPNAGVAVDEFGNDELKGTFFSLLYTNVRGWIETDLGSSIKNLLERYE